MGFESGSIKPRRDLPTSYTEVWGLDLTKNHRAAVGLNIAAFPLFFVFGWSFVEIASFFRPGIANRLHFGQLASQPLLFFLIFFIVVVGLMVLHEAIHGAFFWAFTRSKPIFGLKLLFAYAGAPEWYIPRNQYAFIGLAPLLFITILGFLVILSAPLLAGQMALFGITMNAAGAVGDLYVSGKVMCQSRDVLIQDTGVGFTMFAKLGNAAEMTQNDRKGDIGHER
jgi:hypothetical protein